MSNESPKSKIELRQPTKNDVSQIYDLLAFYAKEKLLLPLTKPDITERLSSFLAAFDGQKVAGCASVRDFGDNLFEIRSLAVSPAYAGHGIGTNLVRALILKIETKPGVRIFALTYRAAFFEQMGFKSVYKELFPQKIWSDCSKCPKQADCDEEALILSF
jgi:amino-acid N-acetyltransferase